jgi:hypothetical protein
VIDIRRAVRWFPVACLLLVPGAARAQEPYSATLSLLGGLGGAEDAEPSPGFDNQGFQLGLALLTEPGVLVGVRAGSLELGDGDDAFGSLLDAQLDYATIAGEYRYREGYYDSGLYLGLGAYRLEGSRGGRDQSDTAPGLVLGITGEFQLVKRLAFLIELSGHYVDLDEARLFGMGHAGLEFRF